MARAKGINGELHCSFCGKRGAEVRRLIAGPGVCICDECVAACRHSLGDVRDMAPAGARPIGTRTMAFRNCGRSGLKLPAIGLGVGRNFGGGCDLDEVARIVSRALDFGIVHFDAANVYGSPAGSAEENLGETLKRLRVDRQELIISTKAGSRVGRGPYQRGSSRKSLVASLNRSLQRLDLPYVDIFYSHQRDPETPLEETAAAFDHLVRQGKTLYVGISNYSVEDTRELARLLRELGTPLLSQQPPYSIFDREAEAGLMPLAEEQGFGLVVYSPLARGLLTGKYNEAVPTDSMEAQHPGALGVELNDALRAKLKALHELAVARGQTIGQMALTWVLREPRVSCALIGARTVEQLEENATALEGAPLSAEELQRIDDILAA